MTGLTLAAFAPLLPMSSPVMSITAASAKNTKRRRIFPRFTAENAQNAKIRISLRSLHCNPSESRKPNKISRSGAFFFIAEVRKARDTELGVSSRTEKGSVLQFLSASVIERNRLRHCRAVFFAVKKNTINDRSTRWFASGGNVPCLRFNRIVPSKDFGSWLGLGQNQDRFWLAPRAQPA
jgi:hypothetical protein